MDSPFPHVDSRSEVAASCDVGNIDLGENGESSGANGALPDAEILKNKPCSKLLQRCGFKPVYLFFLPYLYIEIPSRFY